MQTSKKVRQLKEIADRNRDYLLSRKNVVGYGIGYKEKGGKQLKKWCIRLYVEEKEPISALKRGDLLPEMIEKVPTDVVRSGKIKANWFSDGTSPVGMNEVIEDMSERRTRQRPALGGVSIGHKDITCGTLGCLVKNRNGYTVILSNAHVLANTNRGQILDEIYQPGPYDAGGQTPPENLIGLLERTVPIEMIPNCDVVNMVKRALNILCRGVNSRYRFDAMKKIPINYVDCAIAKPIDADDVYPKIIGYGMPSGFRKAKYLEHISKSGRTSGCTSGQVLDTEGVMRVQYGEGSALFDDLIISDARCGGGDSGAVFISEDNKIVGLLFAGGEGISLGCKIENVKKELDLDIEVEE